MSERGFVTSNDTKTQKNRSYKGSHGVMVSTLDSKFKDPSLSLGGTSM